MSQVIVQSYKLSRTALKTKARVLKVNHDPSHRFTVKSEQNFSLESTQKDGMTSSCCSCRNALW